MLSQVGMCVVIFIRLEPLHAKLAQTRGWNTSCLRHTQSPIMHSITGAPYRCTVPWRKERRAACRNGAASPRPCATTRYFVRPRNSIEEKKPQGLRDQTRCCLVTHMRPDGPASEVEEEAGRWCRGDQPEQHFPWLLQSTEVPLLL